MDNSSSHVHDYNYDYVEVVVVLLLLLLLLLAPLRRIALRRAGLRFFAAQAQEQPFTPWILRPFRRPSKVPFKVPLKVLYLEDHGT